MKTIYLPLLALALTFFSCNKADELTQFDINYSADFTVPAAVNLNLPFNISTPDIESDSDTKFQVQQTSKDKIESISLKTLILNLKSPGGEDFSFLESIEIYIEADGINEERIAWIDNVDESATSITLETSGTDLKPFILKENFNLKARTVTDEAITTDHVIEAKTTFFVDAKLL